MSLRTQDRPRSSPAVHHNLRPDAVIAPQPPAECARKRFLTPLFPAQPPAECARKRFLTPLLPQLQRLARVPPEAAMLDLTARIDRCRPDSDRSDDVTLLMMDIA